MPGATQFPAALDSFPEIGPNTSESAVGVEHDVVHANVHAAVAALQVKVGITASTDPGSVEARLAVAASDIDLLADSQLAHLADADPHPQYLTDAEVDARIGAQKGVALGVVPLNSATQIDTAYLPASVLGQVEYKGTWNATGAPPTAAPEKGWYYVVIVAGSTSLSGITDWQVGDWAIYSGTAWEKVDNTDALASWNGRTGAVMPLAGDYTAEQVGADPAGTAAALITANIIDGDTTHAPSGDAVFDALALKQDAIADSGWLAPTLLNSWINYGGSNSVAGYRKVGNRVYLRGTVKNGTITNGTTLFTLPAGYRPPATYAYRTVNTSTLTSAQVTVSVTGNVGISGIDSSTYLYLDGIAFLID